MAPRAQHRARQRLGGLAVDHGGDAVDHHPPHPGGVGPQALAVAGQVGHQLGLGGAHLVGIEQHDVGVKALGDAAPALEAEQPGGGLGQMADGVLEGGELPAPQAVVDPRGGVAGAGHAVEMGAGVAAADHHRRMLPGLGPQPPALRVVVGGGGPQHGAQIVGQADVHQAEEVPLAALPGDVAHPAALEALVGGREGVADAVAGPAGEAAEHARVGAGRAVLEGDEGLGAAQGLHALVYGQAEGVAPAGQHVQRAEAAQVHVHLHQDRHGERDHDGPGLRGPLAGRDLVAVVVGAGRVDGEHIPVERALGLQRHAGHQGDLVVAEALHAAVGHPFQGGAGVGGRLPAQLQHLLL